jgi:protein-tyrosine-phosphatase
VAFLSEKGHDLGHVSPKGIDQVPNLDYYNVVVGVAKEAQSAFPRTPRNLVYVDWTVDDPSRVEGSPEEVREAYERAYGVLSRNVRDLVGAVLGIPVD